MTKRISLNTIAAAVAYLIDRGFESDLSETVDGPAVKVSLACPRCGGEGRGHWFPDGGICYECNGAKTAGLYDYVPVVDFAKGERRRELARARREREAAKEAEARLERQRDWCEENGFGRITFEERDELRRLEREAAKKASDFVGTPKERRDFELRLEGVASWESPSYSGFGTTTTFLYRFRDADGNSIVWKTTGVGLWVDAGHDDVRPLGTGETVKIKATIKSHDTYRGEKQTTILRPKIID